MKDTNAIVVPASATIAAGPIILLETVLPNVEDKVWKREGTCDDRNREGV